MRACEDPDFTAALEYDLITLGLRFRWVCDNEHDLTWEDILVIISQSPRLSAIVRHIHPDSYQWSLTDHLLATIADAIHVISWQLSGGKSTQPTQIPRPGVAGYNDNTTPEHEDTTLDPFDPNGNGGVFKGEATPIDDLNTWLGWNTPKPTRNEQIINAYATGTTTYRQLAQQFGISPSTIGRIIRAAKE